MKKIYSTFLLLCIAVAMNASLHLTFEKWVGDDLVTTQITKDTTIVVTDYEYDEDLEEATMGVEGVMYSDESANITVTITRSATGIIDQFCAAGNCIPGNGELTQEATFNIGSLESMRRWFTHYTPLAAGKQTIAYLFNDSTNPTITLTVEYAYQVTEQPAGFPRRFLIEHFTGDGCGYCPGGMYAISQYVQESSPSAIWVSHHYGYNTDEYTITESSSIGKMLGVQGAPNMALNRTKQDGVGSTLPFHPGYLPEITINEDTIAPTSVEINHTYNAETRQLDITVSGQTTIEADTSYLLTVLIKENRLVGKQSDYVYSWKTATWDEYMHARVVRDFVTAHFGDTIQVTNQAYSHTLSYTVSEEWVPENCCVVAYLTPLKKKPVINAEQAPLIAGTTGGEEFYPYGITEGKGPNTTVAFDSIQTTKLSNNLMEIMLIASKSIKTNFGAAKAVGLIYLNTEADSLVAGTYPIQEDDALGTITAGYRIDEQCTLGGSVLVYALSNYLKNDIISVAHMWRMQSGDMIVDENGDINFIFYTYNGSKVSATYIVSDVAVDDLHMPEQQAQKFLRDGRIYIIKNDKTYDILGNEVTIQ